MLCGWNFLWYPKLYLLLFTLKLFFKNSRIRKHFVFLQLLNLKKMLQSLSVGQRTDWQDPPIPGQGVCFLKTHNAASCFESHTNPLRSFDPLCWYATVNTEHGWPCDLASFPWTKGNELLNPLLHIFPRKLSLSPDAGWSAGGPQCFWQIWQLGSFREKSRMDTTH